MADTASVNGWSIATDWFTKALDAAVTITNGRYQASVDKQSAAMQQAIDTNNAQQQQATQTNLAKNILLVVGGTLGLILVFGYAKKALK